MKSASWLFAKLALVLSALVGATPLTLPAANQYFSGSGGSTWDTVTADWSAVSGGPYAGLWTNGNTAVFEGAAGTFTVGTGGNPTAGGITFSNTGCTLSGGQLIIGANPLNVVQGVASGNLTVNSVIANGTGANTNLSVNNGSATCGTGLPTIAWDAASTRGSTARPKKPATTSSTTSAG